MKNFSLEFKVGLFTASAVAITVYLFVAISPELFDRKSYGEYYSYLENAKGIVVNSHVKTNGVVIGRVKSIELGTNNTKITIEVDKEVTIPEGSTLQVKSVGLLGDSHIEIFRSEDSQAALSPNSMIPESQISGDLSGLISSAGRIADDLEKVTSNLSKALGTTNGENAIQSIVDDLQVVISNTRGMITENRTSVKDMTANIAEIASSLKDILNLDNQNRIGSIISNLDETLREVEIASKHVKQISKKIDDGNGTIGKLVNDDKALIEVEEALKDIRQVIGGAKKLKITVDGRFEASELVDSQSDFNLLFQTRPDKYYLVGFADTGFKTIDEKKNIRDCDADDAQCDSRETRYITEKNAIKFNLQFAKSWYFLTMRVGLFQNAGGFAADFNLWKDNIRYTVEAYDWQTRNNPIRKNVHLKTYFKFLFFDHVYLVAGLDDPLRYAVEGVTEDYISNSWFYGAGLQFTDQDLKSLIGVASLGSSL